MKTKVFSIESVEEIESAIIETKEEGITPNLALVFSSIVFNLANISKIFNNHGIDLFGASSYGEIVEDEVFDESIALMLLEIDGEAYRLKLFDGEEKASYQVGKSVAEWAKTQFEDPAFMLAAGGLMADGQQIINGVGDTMGRHVPLFGGLASDDLKMQGTFVFNKKRVSQNGIMALIFNRNIIDLHGVSVSGWKGIGTPKTITRSEGNIVYSIDNNPTLDVYAKYLNIESEIGRAAEYPLLLLRDDDSFVLRAALAINDDKSIVYGGTIPEGSKVRFSIPPGPEIIGLATEQLGEFKKQISSADAIVLFSCAARSITLGPMVEDEICAVNDLWETPLMGFFTYGEFGPNAQGQCDYHNNTLVLTLIREK